MKSGRLPATLRIGWPRRRRLRLPVIVAGRRGEARERGDAAPALGGFGIATAVLAVLLLVSLLLPSGLVAVEGPLDPQPLEVGDDFVYRLVVANHGRVPVWLRGVRVDVAAPLWLVTAAEPARDADPVVAAGRREVLAPVGAFLMPGEERVVGLRVRALEPGELVIRDIRLEFAQLLDPRALEVASPDLVAVVNPSPAAEPVFAEQGQFGRSFEGLGYRFDRVEAEYDGDVARLTLFFKGGDESEPPGFLVERAPEGEGIDLVIGSGAQLPRRLQIDRELPGFGGLTVERTGDGDHRVRIAVEDLLEYRALARSDPPRIVVEWRQGTPMTRLYEVRVPWEAARTARAILDALVAESPVVAPLRTGREGQEWVAVFDRRYAVDRLVQALTAAGVEVQTQLEGQEDASP